ncbi:beta-galactosidase [Victivallis sp. Marseille-Q1083]|uniref:beta-galactosidase n=1 Tax=Victivallis sp. Marseille-Q1083 TaxID=2717288 RepID=UPI00158F169D|nr:beta-galactosidase [Victivallis sp. Marseille-Q1083]
MMNRKQWGYLLLLAGLWFGWNGTAGAAVAELEQDGQRLYRLSNDCLTVVINPSCGGRVEEFRRTGGVNLVSPRPADLAPGGSGLGQERLRSGGVLVDRTAWVKWKVVAAGGENGRSFVTLENSDSPLHFVKTYTLRDGIASLTVDYAVDNPGTGDFIGNLWFITAPFPEGTGAMRYYYPLAEQSSWPDLAGGRASLEPVRWPETDGNITVNHAAAGWVAALNDAGNGILLETGYPDLGSFYQWLPDNPMLQGTLEFLTGDLKIRPLSEGKALAQARPEREDSLFDYIFRTSYSVMPLDGCEAVNAADNHIAGYLTREAGRLRAVLRSDRDYGTVTARCGEAERPVTLNALAAAELDLPLPDESPVVSLELLNAEGRKIATLVKSFETAHRPPPAAEKNTLFTYAPNHAELFTDFPQDIICWAADTAEKTSLLLFAVAWSHRDSAELTVRGNFDFDLVEVGYPHQLAFDISDNRSWIAPDPVDYARRMVDRAHEVIVIASTIRWEILPEEVRERIAAQVAEGTGLIYVDPPGGIESLGLELHYNPEATENLNRAVPYEMLPAIRTDADPAAPPLKVYDCGQGRVIAVNYRLNQNDLVWQVESYGLVPGPDFAAGCRFNYYDYHFSQLLRAIRLAARRRPAAEITGMTADPDRLTLAVAAAAPAAGSVVLEVRNKYGEVVDRTESEAVLPQGAGQLVLPLPTTQMTLDGDYFYNAFLKIDDHTADWFTVVQNRPAAGAIEKFTLAKKSFEPGEAVTGTIRFRGAVDGAGLSLVMKDRYDRLLARRNFTELPPELTFSIEPAVRPETTLSTVELELTRDGRLLDRTEATWTTQLPPRNGLTFTCWGSCSNYFADEYHRYLVEMGFDEVIGYDGQLTDFGQQRIAAESALRSNINYIPIGISRLMGWTANSKPNSDGIRTPCLRDPEYLAELGRTVNAVVANIADYQPNAYFIGDENSLFMWDIFHDYCHSPRCLAAFRTWLRTRYASLAELNAAWQTDFTAWEQVKPLKLAEAQQQRQYASWIEHRTFMFTALTGAVKTEYEAMKAADPAGRLGVSGMAMTDLNVGFDWHEVLPYLDRAIVYEHSGLDDVLRSFARPGSGLGSWTGYNAAVPEIRENNYRQILNGLRANGNWANGYLLRHGDLKVNDYGRQLKEMIAELKQSGLDVITEPANRMPSPFALYFSIPSMLLCDATDERVIDNRRCYQRNFGGWTGLLANLGWPGPLVIGPGELPELDPERTPYLILPLAQAMSDADLEAIERYVASGGKLIADVLPGVCYDNGNPRPENPFRKLFGVEARLRSPADPAECPVWNGRTLEAELGDSQLKLTGGRPLLAADRRIMIGNAGHLLLNLLPNRYGRGRANTALADPVTAVFRTALELAGARDDWTILLPPNAEAARYTLDGNCYVGLTRAAVGKEERDDAVLRFDRPYCIYDLLQRRLVGTADCYETALDGCDVRLLALLPEPTRPYSLSVAKRGREMTAVVENPGIAGLFRLEVFRPDGMLYPPATGNHAGKPRTEVAVDPGLEPMPGEWVFKVINLLDNTTVEKTVRW